MFDGKDSGRKREGTPLGVSISVLAFFHLVAFAAVTFPWILSFSDSFMADPGDGFQNYWNFWWVRFAIGELHANPWYSFFQFYPAGAPLVVHTLSAVNTFPAALLSGIFSISEAHNLAVILSFILTGVTSGLLIRSYRVSYLGQIVGSFAFAYCSYRFAHAQGHLNLITTQWIPLFLILWRELLARPAVTRSVIASLAFGLVFFSDYYYAVYTALVAVGFVVGHRGAADIRWWRAVLPSLLVFTVVTISWSYPFVSRLMQLSATGIQQTHAPAEFSLDLASAFLPGAYWIFGDDMSWMWTTLRAGPVEGSAYLGWGTMLLASCGLLFGPVSFRNRLTLALIAAAFLLFSFGPELQVFGKATVQSMPYTALETIIPILKVGGIPSRMAMVSSLMLAVLVGIGIQGARGKGWIAVAMLGTIMVVESIPGRLPSAEIPRAALAEKMRELPRDYAVMDPGNVAPMAHGLYWQTIYQLPKWNGYISRLPRYVERSTSDIGVLARAGSWQHLCEKEGFRYLIFDKARLPREFREDGFVISDGDLGVIDLGRRWSCKRWQERVIQP